MEQVISKAALKNILTAAGPDVIDMDDDTKKVLAALWELYNEAQQDTLLLANLSNCAEYVLWKGADDVRYLVESGCYQDELQHLSDDEQEALYRKVAENVDWSDVAAASVSAGNAVIEAELASLLTADS